MHLEINVALNFVISYLYNKLPRRRVDLLGTEIENGLKKKFEGHWYPDQPMKGSGYRCVRVSGEKIDPVMIKAATSVGVSLEEMTEYMPLELTLWIDPNEVSYKIGEKGQVKILYSNRNNEENIESEDREVQATNNGFNPEAQAFNPDAQSFEPIDRLSSSMGNLILAPSTCGLSPMSPVSPLSWNGSQSASPSGGVPFSGTSETVSPPSLTKRQGNQVFTTASFAQTKFGSTKLKSNAKRPTRLSPTEFGNFLRQKVVPPTTNNKQQYSELNTPPRSRSLSPRDPRVEFMIDQHQRFIHNQHQLQQQFQHQQMLQQQHQQQQLHFQLQHQNRLNLPPDHAFVGQAGRHVSGALHDMFSGPSPLQSPDHSPVTLLPGQTLVSPTFHHPDMTGYVTHQGSLPSPVNPIQISPENQSALFEGLGLNNKVYSPTNHHLLLAN